MQTIDYIYRFDPKNPGTKPPPADATAARVALEEGNRLFAKWMVSCQTSDPSAGASHHVVQCNGLEVGLVRKPDGVPKQSPFAAVVGCSDARVPLEMVFGQGFNNLFVVRVAGNVLGDVCQGSLDFALSALKESVKVVVVVGHAGCGAVTGAVDAYLTPANYWSRAMSPALRAIVQKLLVAVCEAANALDAVWGANASEMAGYREALIDIATCVNAAQTALDLRHAVAAGGKQGVDVLYGVYDLHTHRVGAPLDRGAGGFQQPVGLAPAPADHADLTPLARHLAGALRFKNALAGQAPAASKG